MEIISQQRSLARPRAWGAHMPTTRPPSYRSQRPLTDSTRLPGDTKPREIYNLFRDFPGYVSSHLCSGKSSQAYAFAVFGDQPSALAALRATNGRIFDLEKNCTLHVDLAKANSRSKRLRSDDASPYSSEKKDRNPSGFSDSGAGSNVHMSGIGNSSHSLIGYPSAQSYTNTKSSTSLTKDPTTFAPQNNPPCSTLFIANLGPTCAKQELIDVFSSCAGYVKLKMQDKLGAPVAFVDFKDVNSSTEALNRLQGVILYSSPGEGIRLEYAKSRMGSPKRDRRP